MKRIVAAAAAMTMVVAMSESLRAIDTLQWVGGASADWNDPNVWKNLTTNATGDAQTLMGRRNGLGNPLLNVVIGGGSRVEYYRPTPNSDFRLAQGNTLTVKEGAVWVQETDATYPENGWSTADPTKLILDGGTFRRSGESPAGDGGGLLILGSYRDDENSGIIPIPPAPFTTVDIKNAGRLENTGQLWFGAENEHTDGRRVHVIVNNGVIDLTGGGIPQSNNTIYANADLAFWYDYNEAEGRPKNEDYEINYRGPGTVIVDAAGIYVFRQDDAGTWTGEDSVPATEGIPGNGDGRVSYEDLWNQGILKSKGMSGANGSNLAFANFFNVAGTPGVANYTLTRKEATVVNWDGGTGNWSTDVKWNGQNAQTAFNDIRGTEGGRDIVIDGTKPGGANVTYNGTGDFRVNQNNGIGSVTVKNGGVLELHSNSAEDGVWTRWLTDLKIDGGTFRRTKDGVASQSGGAFILGAFGPKPGLEMNLSVTNGGVLQNDGQLWFGDTEPGDDSKDQEITLTINNGTVDLTGGDSFPLLGVGIEPDLIFTFGYDPLTGPLNEKHTINFTGPGSLTVDHSGIYVITYDENLTPTPDDTTYQDLWNKGILQANGLSGLDGATFSSFFSTTGTLGTDNYKLTSLLTGAGADTDSDGDVDGADFLTLQRNGSSFTQWKSSFGGGATAAGAPVPEPATLGIAMIGLAGFGLYQARRRRLASR